MSYVAHQYSRVDFYSSLEVNLSLYYGGVTMQYGKYFLKWNISRLGNTAEPPKCNTMPIGNIKVAKWQLLERIVPNMVLVFWILHSFDAITNTVTSFSKKKNVSTLVKCHIIYHFCKNDNVV